MQKIIGQTGTTVLSDEKIQYKLDKKRTVRYQYTKIGTMWSAWVCGPFHSALYGVTSFGATRTRAKSSLKRRLASGHSYIGHMMFSDVDESDTVGNVRITDDRKAAPLGMDALCGKAGQ